MSRIILFLMIVCSVSALDVNAGSVRHDKWRELFLKAWDNRLSAVGLTMADSLYAEGVRGGDVCLQCRAAAVKLVYYYHNPSGERLKETVEQVQELSRKDKYLYPYYYFAGLFAVDDCLNHRYSIKAMRTAHIMEQQADEDKMRYGYHCVYLANAIIYSHNGEYNKALQLAGKAIGKASDVNDSLNTYACMVRCYMKMKQYENALGYTGRMCAAANNDGQRFMALQMHCIVLYNLRRHEDFKVSFAQLEALSRRLGNGLSDEMKLVRVYSYIINGQNDKAEVLAATMNDGFLNEKIEVMKAQGNYREALRLFMRMLQYNDSLSYANIHNDFDDIDNEVGNIAMKRNIAAAQDRNVSMRSENLRLKVINSELELLRLKEENKIREESNRKSLLMIKKNNAELGKLNAKREMDKVKADDLVSRYSYQKKMLAVGIVALLLIIVMIVVYLYYKRKTEKSIDAKNRQLINARLLLEESQQRKRVFLKSISHEIRTPANAIMGFAGVLTIPGLELSDDEVRDVKMRIRMNSRHLQTLVSDILDTKGLETGRIGIKLSEVRVNEVCSLAMSCIREQCDAKGIRLYFTSDVDDDYTIVTDGWRLQQVLVNYLTNAEKNTVAGYIRLSFSTTESKDWVTFSVEDTGCGVPLDKTNAVFERFEKVNQFTQGTGMGLYMCRIIADRLHGMAEVDKNYRNGARFMFKIKKAMALLLMMMSLTVAEAAPVAVAAAGDGKDIQQLYDRAKGALRSPECLTLADSVFNMAGRRQDRDMQCKAIYVHVAYYLNMGDDDATFRCCERLMNFADKYAVKHYYYLAWYTRINRLFLSYRSTEALRQLNAMRQQALTENYKYGIARCYRAVGNIYMRNGDYSMAKKRFLDELHTIEHADTRQDLGDVYEKIGSCQKFLGQYEEAAATFDKAISTSELPKVKCENKAWRGIVAFMLNDRQTFLKYYEELCADPLAMQTMTKIIVRQLNMFYYISVAQWAKAFEICDVSDPGAMDYMLLADYYYFAGDVAKALEMKEKRLVAEKMHRTDVQREDVARHLSQMKKDRMDIEKRLLEQENFILNMNNKELNLNKFKLELESEANKRRIERTMADNHKLTLREQTAAIEQAQIEEKTDQEEKTLEEARYRRNLAIMVSIIVVSLVVLAFLCCIMWHHRNSLTLLREKNRELEARLEEVDRSGRLKEEFLAQMSHDVNQPLNAIVGFTELLLRDAYKDDEDGKRKAREMIEQSMQRLLDIVTKAVDKAMK